MSSLTKQKNKIAELTTQVQLLEEYVALAIKRQFAAKSEKSNINQLSFFDEFTRKKLGRKALPKELHRNLFYRQEQILRRIGVDSSSATIRLWIIKCAALLKPLADLLPLALEMNMQHFCLLT